MGTSSHPSAGKTTSHFLHHERMHGAQVTAWLHCKVRHTAAALRAGGGAFAGMDDAALAAYAAGLLGEWLSPAWQGKLSAAYGLPASGAGLCGAVAVSWAPCCCRRAPAVVDARCRLVCCHGFIQDCFWFYMSCPVVEPVRRSAQLPRCAAELWCASAHTCTVAQEARQRRCSRCTALQQTARASGPGSGPRYGLYRISVRLGAPTAEAAAAWSKSRLTSRMGAAWYCRERDEVKL